MTWTVEFNDYSLKQFNRLDAPAQKRIAKYLNDNIEGIDDPRIFGKSLVGEPSGRWRYRAGDYRIICRMEDDVQIVVVLYVGHRKNIYKKKK